jgi:Arf-GAP/coiled-coil/ANK repeat/PH domain-containing protein
VASRLESLVENEVTAFGAARSRYDKARSVCDSARADYLNLRKSAEGDARLRAARALDDARATLRAERAALSRAAAAAEAARASVLLDAAADAGEAYADFFAAAAEAAAPLPAAVAALRSRAAARRAQAAEGLAAANAAASAFLAAGEPLGSAAAAEEASTSGHRSPTAGAGAAQQNLGRSHDADIRRLLAAGPGTVIRQGYLQKQARTWGWRRRFFVLDSAGTLTYYNEAQLVAAATAKATARAGAAAHAAAAAHAGSVTLPPPPPVPPPDSHASSASSHSSSSSSAAGARPGSGGFGAKMSSFLKNKAEAVATRMEAVASRIDEQPGGTAGASGAAPAGGGDDGGDDDEDKFASRTVNLQVSTVKVDGDPADRGSRDAAFAFRLVSPGGSLTLQAESAAERDGWVAALQGVIAELITAGVGAGGRGRGGAAAAAGVHAAGLSVAAAVAAGPGNGSCADCGAPEPDWASLSAVQALCQHCAGAHRSLGTHISKVRSIALDADSWAPPIIALFTAIGNAGGRAAWEGGRGGAAAPPVVPAGADAEARSAAIRDKYAKRAFVTHAALAAAASEAGPAALVAAAAAGETGRLLKIIAAGAPAATPGALHAAARRGEAGAPAAALLLLNGADPLAADGEGHTPAEVAAAAGAAPDGPLFTLLRNAANKAQA